MRLWPLSGRMRLFLIVFITVGNVLIVWDKLSRKPLKTPDPEISNHDLVFGHFRYQIMLPDRFVLTERTSTKVVFSLPDTRSEPRITLSSVRLAETGPVTECIDIKAGHTLCSRTDAIPNGNGPRYERVSGYVSWKSQAQILYFTIDDFSELYRPNPGLLLRYFYFLKRAS